jgi:glycosyltransferase involved in cell wall biosynthesis
MSRASDARGRQLTVLQSFPRPLPTTNPYLVLLAEQLRAEGVTVLAFSWRTALLARYDVYHSHWPEILVTGRTPMRKLARQLLAVLFLLRLWATRRPIVRTVHNIERPEGLGWRERILLDWIDRQTALRIRLNVHTVIPEGQPFETIPHGHYRDWFARYPRSAPVRGRLGYAGLIRRYKGVETLLAAFEGAADSDTDLTLRVGGKPSSEELAEAVRRAADTDSRISAVLEFLSDGQLVEILTASELAVFPYRFMHNSGGALAALSLDVPILVPRNAVNEDLAVEVGPGWVHFFDTEVTSADLLRALADARGTHRSARPNLDAREWPQAAALHIAAYRRAIGFRSAR